MGRFCPDLKQSATQSRAGFCRVAERPVLFPFPATFELCLFLVRGKLPARNKTVRRERGVKFRAFLKYVPSCLVSPIYLWWVGEDPAGECDKGRLAVRPEIDASRAQHGTDCKGRTQFFRPRAPLAASVSQVQPMGLAGLNAWKMPPHRLYRWAAAGWPFPQIDCPGSHSLGLYVSLTKHQLCDFILFFSPPSSLTSLSTRMASS